MSLTKQKGAWSSAAVKAIDGAPTWHGQDTLPGSIKELRLMRSFLMEQKDFQILMLN